MASETEEAAAGRLVLGAVALLGSIRWCILSLPRTECSIRAGIVVDTIQQLFDEDVKAALNVRKGPEFRECQDIANAALSSMPRAKQRAQRERFLVQLGVPNIH
jgi:hypothetical protein